MMNKIKKAILILIFTAIFLPVFSFDFGGEINNDLFMSIKDISTPNLDEAVSARLWFFAPLDTQQNTVFNADGNFSFNVLMPEKKFYYTLDLTQFNITMKIPLGITDYCSFDMGRIGFQDFTKEIFSGYIDALRFDFNLLRFNFNFLLGYTGLTNAQTQRKAFSTIDSTKSYVMNDPSLVFYFSINPHKNILDFIDVDKLQFDIFSNLNLKEDQLNQIYLSLLLSDTITDIISYDIATTLLMFGSSQAPGNYTKGNVNFQLNDAVFGISAAFASSDSKKLSTFTPYHQIYIDPANSIMPSGILKLGLLADFKISKSIFLKSEIDYFHNLATKTAKASFNSLQWNLDFDFNIISDFRFSLGGGQKITSFKELPFFFDFSMKLLY